MLDKTVIARNFSKSASRYDEFANIQRLAANHLIEEIPGGRLDRILEIGCGTGIYTRLLKAGFKYSNIRAVDISEKMIQVACEKIRDEKVVFEVGDAEKIALDEEYDLITSNSAIQWFESIEKTLQRYSSVLKKGAWLIFSTFGPLTFTELATSLRKIRSDKNLFVASRDFLDKEELERLLAKYFNKVSVKEIVTQEKYPSLEALLKKIKYTGSRGCITGCGYLWSQGLLKAVEDAYIGDLGRIIATYQIFLCRAER